MEHLVQILETERGEPLYYDAHENDFCIRTASGHAVSVRIGSFLKTLDGTHVKLCEAFLPWVQLHIAALRCRASEPQISDVVIGEGVPASHVRAEAHPSGVRPPTAEVGTLVASSTT